jgi:hypothetical protein
MKDTENTQKTGASAISLESAEKQLHVMLDFYRIKKDRIVNEYGQDGVATLYNKLTDAIADGLVIIEKDSDKGLKITQRLIHPPGDIAVLEYAVLTGKHRMAMDGLGETKGNARMYALMGALAGLPPSAMQSLVGADLGIMGDLSLIFLLI